MIGTAGVAHFRSAVLQDDPRPSPNHTRSPQHALSSRAMIGSRRSAARTTALAHFISGQGGLDRYPSQKDFEGPRVPLGSYA
jgi:hypothetical protein